MKRTTISYIALSLSVILIATTSACAGRQVAPGTSLRHLTQEDPYAYSYEVTFVKGEKYKLSDDDIVVKDGLIGIRFHGENGYRFYPTERIREIRATKKTHRALGAGIGAAIGVAAGIGTALALPNNCKDDPNICSLSRLLIAVPIGAAVGTGAGMAIGSAVPKKKRPINISPKIYGAEKMKVTGAGIGVSGSF